MKNREVWASYDFYTGEVTKHARYLGFAGMAICWFFRTPEITFPSLILSSLVLLVIFFLLDLCQYYVAAMGLRAWMYAEEAKNEQSAGGIDQDYWPPKHLDVPVFRLFKLKLLFLVAGFLLIGVELISRISQSNVAL